MAKLQVPSNAEVVRKEGRRWPLLLLLVIASLLIATGVAYGGRWAYREFVEDEPAGTPAELQSEAAPEGATERSQQSGDSSNSAESEPSGTETETSPLPDTGG